MQQLLYYRLNRTRLFDGRRRNGSFRSDRNTVYTDAALRTLAATPGQELTYTCVPPAFTATAAGTRAGIDRDEDGVLDGLDDCPAVTNGAQTDVDADLAGDVCDNCVAKANGDQSDVDADGTGDVCDNLCVGTVTSISSATPQVASGSWIAVTGTGFGPSMTFQLGGTTAVQGMPNGGNVFVKVPTSLPLNQSYPLVALNPEGCRSQESVAVLVTAPPSCGLLGIEPVAALLMLRRLRSSGRRLAA